MILEQEQPKYNKKRIFIALSLALVILAGIMFFILRGVETYQEKTPPRTFEPSDTNVAHQDENGYFSIPLVNLTEGRTGRVSAQVSYTFKDLGKGMDATFQLRGIFRGEGFYSNALYDKEKKLAISIGPNMHPSNHFIEAFIVWDVVDGQPTAYIYVDEEWKTYVGDSWIVWGKDFQKSKKFEWISVADGIYMNKVYDEWSRFDQNLEAKQGGIAIANMNSKEAILQKSEDVIAVVLK